MSAPASPVGGVVFRQEAAGDAVAVHALLQTAFGGTAEATLVNELRAGGELVLALVAAEGTERIVGYVGFPRLQIETAEGSRPAVGLAPLAVASSHQGRGIGGALVRAGLAQLIARREDIVFVLGDPALYGRFGFSTEDARPFASPYAGPHFMARRLAAGAPRRGRLRYPAAFDELG
jgi:putative acetyltransferase